jgi:putative methionine-R-sulfoxide reductase with GAF domain
VLVRRCGELEQLAKLGTAEPWHLSMDIDIENVAAPDAGLEVPRPPGAPRQATNSIYEVSDLGHLQGFLDAVSFDESFLSLPEALSIFSERLAKLVHYESVAVYVPRNGRLAAAHTAGSHRAALNSILIPLGQGVSGWAADTNRPVLNGNPAVEFCYSTAPCDSDLPASVLALPLPGAMAPAGVLSLYASSENAFSVEDINILAALVPALGKYLENHSSTIGAQCSAPLPAAVLKTPAAGVSALIH